METYTTNQGNTWDIIAKKHYDDEMQMHRLIAANPECKNVVIFGGGTELNIPKINENEINVTAPPWA